MDFAQPPPLHQALEVTGHQLDKNKSAETFSPTFVNRDSLSRSVLLRNFMLVVQI